MVVAVDKLGVTPLPQTMFGVTLPLHKIGGLELDVTLALPVEKYDAVPLPPVPAGKLIAATGETLLAVTVQPPDVLATLTRAYDEYVMALVS
jgi:hypothetical protein